MQNRYVLLTAAKNEASYIGETIESVLKQSIHPIAWFVMDDGSTDDTAAIVRKFAAQHPFIHLHSGGEGQGRNFGSQYKAIRAAYELARHLDFDYVGVQDADIAPQSADYYASILKAFSQDPGLGIAGGYIYERANGNWCCRKGNSTDSVAGGVQLFRRACYEKIDGYKPLKLGGSDWLAQIEARMAGWEAVAFPEYPVYHYRPTSSANGRLRGLFRLGLMDASFGSHLLFEMIKCCRRLGESPPLVGSIIRFSGYLWWRVNAREPLIGSNQVTFLRKKQSAKIWNVFRTASNCRATSVECSTIVPDKTGKF
jgi:biofilm PGA synthesis N-glycosyltransferase PgaC